SIQQSAQEMSILRSNRSPSIPSNARTHRAACRPGTITHPRHPRLRIPRNLAPNIGQYTCERRQRRLVTRSQRSETTGGNQIMSSSNIELRNSIDRSPVLQFTRNRGSKLRFAVRACATTAVLVIGLTFAFRALLYAQTPNLTGTYMA